MRITIEQENQLMDAGQDYALDNPDIDESELANGAYDLARSFVDCEGWKINLDAAADIVYTGMMRAKKAQ